MKSRHYFLLIPTVFIIFLIQVIQIKESRSQSLTELRNQAIKDNAARDRAGSNINPRENSLSSLAEKARCPSKDMRNKLPPIRDQDSVGWCTAFTAADLLSFKSGKNISASDVALSYYERVNEQIRVNNPNRHSQRKSPPLSEESGGGVAGVLRAVKEKGACLESDFPSQDHSNSTMYTELQHEIRTIERYTSQGGSKESCRNCVSDSEVANAISNITPRVDPARVLEDIRNIENNRVINHLNSLACTRRIPFSNIEFQETNKLAVPLDDILEQIKNNKIVGIGYNATIIAPRHFMPPGNTNHASSIVGMRWNERTNTCDLLVRNSWGKTCAPYHATLTCEEGYIWVPAETLYEATNSVTFI